MNETILVPKMSLKKKMLIALAAVVAVFAIVITSVMTTVALLHASDAVSNVFTIGQVGISISETIVKPDGTPVTDRTNRGDTNTYHLIPCSTYLKDPIITVLPDSHESYLFISVRNDIANIAADDPENGKPTIAYQLKENGWAYYQETQAGKIYVYVGEGNVPDSGSIPLDAPKSAVEFAVEGEYPLFETFSVGDYDCSSYGAAQIKINAFALQSTSFETVDAAWAEVVANYGYLHLNPISE